MGGELTLFRPYNFSPSITISFIQESTFDLNISCSTFLFIFCSLFGFNDKKTMLIINIIKIPIIKNIVI
ncbi:MAG: hypothetical protein QXE31_05695 [Candidatus Woesearchaeota archaeon]